MVFICMDGVGGVDCFIGIDAGRKILNIIRAKDECQENNTDDTRDMEITECSLFWNHKFFGY